MSTEIESAIVEEGIISEFFLTDIPDEVVALLRLHGNDDRHPVNYTRAEEGLQIPCKLRSSITPSPAGYEDPVRDAEARSCSNSSNDTVFFPSMVSGLKAVFAVIPAELFRGLHAQIKCLVISAFYRD
ncbi:MAG: hypothetical protein MZV63_49155 [Marinilabiliales bacterium]|nr:hypothetical protein [Marinilabiliales bacterium]